jgi:hypothetical protein
MNKYFIGISISELQQWLADDELPVITERITHSRNPLGASLSGSELESLFKFLPAFSLDDTAGVMIVEVSGPETWKADENPHIRYLALSEVRKFIPLTDDAKIALSVNWSRVIQLSESVFEQQFTHFRIIRKSLIALKAGNLFANLFIDHGPTRFSATSLFAKALPRALMAAEHRNPNEIEKLRYFGDDELPETWVERAFGDIKKYDKENKLIILRKKSENIRDIASVGILLSTVVEVKDLTDKFRSIYIRLEGTAKDHNQSFVFVFADLELSQLKASFNVYSKDGESISLVTLGLFLRWKQAFHDQRSTVNAQSILSDVNNLIGFVDVELVANALWMMGAYLGMENISPTYRYLHQEKYHALRFVGNENVLKPVVAWQVKNTNQSAEYELSPDSVQDSVAAKIPENKLALKKYSPTTEEQQSAEQEKTDVPEAKLSESEQECFTNCAEHSTDKSGISEPASAVHTSVTSRDVLTQQAQQLSQTANKVIESSERTTENDQTLTETESSSSDVVQTSAAGSNHVSNDNQQAAPSASSVSECQTDTSGVESRQVRPTKTKSLKRNGSNKTERGVNKSVTSFNSEGVSSPVFAKPDGSQVEREGGSSSGKVGQDDSLF